MIFDILTFVRRDGWTSSPSVGNARFQQLCKMVGIWSSGATECTVYSSKHSKQLFYKLMCQICLYKYIFWFIMYIYVCVFLKCTIGNWPNYLAWKDTHTFWGSASECWILWGRQCWVSFSITDRRGIGRVVEISEVGSKTPDMAVAKKI
jgi:hypothetical protein